MSNNTWIHIGFPKCASTSLQKDFFSQCPEIDYTGRYKNWTTHPKRGLYVWSTARLMSLGDVHYQQSKQEIHEQILGEFSNDPDLVRVISDETFTISYLPSFRHLPIADAKLIAKRLFELFPNAKILMIIRNQIQFIPSLVNQIMRDQNIDIDTNMFFDFHRLYAEKRTGSMFHMGDYNSMYDCYEQVFGAGRVHVVLLEDMAANPLRMMTRLVDLLGLSGRVNPEDYLPGHHNAGLSEYDMFRKKHKQSLRLISRLVPSRISQVLAVPVKKLLSNKPATILEITAPRESFLNSFYGPGNRVLQEKLGGTCLADAGYPMGDQ